jgi:hypothetical protein
MKDENKEIIVWMKGIWTTWKNASWVGQVGMEEWMVHFTPFLLLFLFLFFFLLKFRMCMHMCVLGGRSWKTTYIGRDLNKMWKGENLQMKKGKRREWGVRGGGGWG